MIIKKKSYKTLRSFQQKVMYVLQDKGRRDPHSTWAIFHNFCGTDPQQIIQEMEANAALLPPRKDRNLCLMDILSFHPKDCEKITEESLREVAQEYIQARGLDRHYVLAVPHIEEKHLHIHLVYSANEVGARKVQHLSNGRFGRIKRDFELWQISRFPEWIHSIVQTKKRKRKPERVKDQEIQMKKRIGSTQTEKEKIWKTLSPLFARSNTMQEFCQLIGQKSPYSVYEYRGKPNGVETKEGIKHRFSKLQLTAKILGQLEPLTAEQSRIQSRQRQLKKIHDDHLRKKREKGREKDH